MSLNNCKNPDKANKNSQVETIKSGALYSIYDQKTDNSQSILDEIDRRILSELQTDARASVTEIARRVGLSKTPVTLRIKHLEENFPKFQKRIKMLPDVTTMISSSHMDGIHLWIESRHENRIELGQMIKRGHWSR